MRRAALPLSLALALGWTATGPAALAATPAGAGAPAATATAAGAVRGAAGATPWRAPAHAQWTASTSGHKSDRVNVYVQGTAEEVRAVFGDAGWHEAAPLTLKNNLKYVGAIARAEVVRGADAATFHRFHLRADEAEDTIQHMPVSTQTLGGRPTAVAFEKDNQPFGGRHHFRVFDTGKVGDDGRPVWGIAASRDRRLVFQLRNWKTLFTNHEIVHNADHERDLVGKTAADTGHVASTTRIQMNPDKPTLRGLYSKDGQALLLVLDKGAAARAAAGAASP